MLKAITFPPTPFRPLTYTDDHNIIAGCTLSLPVTLSLSPLHLPQKEQKNNNKKTVVQYVFKMLRMQQQHWGFSLFALLCWSVFEDFSLLMSFVVAIITT